MAGRYRHRAAVLPARGQAFAAGDRRRHRQSEAAWADAVGHLCRVSPCRAGGRGRGAGLDQSASGVGGPVPDAASLDRAILDRLHLDRARQCGGGGVQRFALQPSGHHRHPAAGGAADPFWRFWRRVRLGRRAGHRHPASASVPGRPFPASADRPVGRRAQEAAGSDRSRIDPAGGLFGVFRRGGGRDLADAGPLRPAMAAGAERRDTGGGDGLYHRRGARMARRVDAAGEASTDPAPAPAPAPAAVPRGDDGIAAAAAAHGVTIEPACRDGVAANCDLLASHAARMRGEGTPQ